MKYETVNDAARLEMLNNRVGQLEQEHYSHEVAVLENEARRDAAGRDVDPEQFDQAIANGRAAQQVIELSLRAVKAERDVLKAAVAKATPKARK